VLATNAVLIVTAFGLYYTGSEMLRRWTSDIHIAVGLGFPLLLLLHVILGKRLSAARRAAAARRREDPDRSPEQRAAVLR
jgi:small-conductance mechanosensitive channel